MHEHVNGGELAFVDKIKRFDNAAEVRRFMDVRSPMVCGFEVKHRLPVLQDDPCCIYISHESKGAIASPRMELGAWVEPLNEKLVFRIDNMVNHAVGCHS